MSDLLVPKYLVGDFVLVNGYSVRIDSVKQAKDDVYYGVTLLEPIGMIHSISISERTIVGYVGRTNECSCETV